MSSGGTPAYVPEILYSEAYAIAGNLAAKFGGGKITDGLKLAKEVANDFSDLTDHRVGVPAATESLRRSASDGLAYVCSLESAKKPLLPKIWLDWKAAHQTGR